MISGQTLVQIVDSALAEAVRKAGPWLACRSGCFQCCLGPFAITGQDAELLREGMAAIEPERAARVRQRARGYPAEPLQVLLAEDGPADEVACPALDPETGTCDLYAWRPVTCRTFGPPLHFRDEAVAICELCFVGASVAEVAASDVEIGLDSPDDEATATVVAHVLAGRT